MENKKWKIEEKITDHKKHYAIYKILDVKDDGSFIKDYCNMFLNLQDAINYIKKEEEKNMEKLETIKNLKEEIRKDLQNTICDRICDYNNGYISDVISEIADNAIDLYNDDLFEWAKHNYDYIEEANQNYGLVPDITKQIQQGQYYYYTQELYSNINDMLKLFAYDYLYNNKIELNSNQLEELADYIDSLDNNDRLEDIMDKIDELKEREK